LRPGRVEPDDSLDRVPRPSRRAPEPGKGIGASVRPPHCWPRRACADQRKRLACSCFRLVEVMRRDLVLQTELEGLPNKVMAETVVGLLADQLESGPFVDATRSLEDAVGPQNDLRVPRLPCETDAFPHQLRANPQAARARLDEQEPK